MNINNENNINLSITLLLFCFFVFRFMQRLILKFTIKINSIEGYHIYDISKLRIKSGPDRGKLWIELSYFKLERILYLNKHKENVTSKISRKALNYKLSY